MATFRENPYAAFNFLVSLGGASGDGGEGTIVGGFSEVSGLKKNIEYAEYRNGNERFNTVRKIPNVFKVDDVTLKRGLIGSTDLADWFKTVEEGTPDPRQVTITQLDEARQAVANFVLRNAQPKSWTGPSLAAKGGSDSAMEELVVTCEAVSYE